MGTKAQAIAALVKHCPGATIIDEHPPTGHLVQIEAPQGYHWEGSVHCIPAPYWHSGLKREYWDEVLEEISMLGHAVPCNDSDCEGIATWGECEYWEVNND